VYQSTFGIMLIQNVLSTGVDGKGAKFTGNEQTYRHSTSMFL